MNLEERKFNMENIDKLNQKLDDYLKDIANPLLKKINFLQSQ
jgi:DNA-dependent RNA polymerase auxiliary subunit epsilon